MLCGEALSSLRRNLGVRLAWAKRTIVDYINSDRDTGRIRVTAVKLSFSDRVPHVYYFGL